QPMLDQEVERAIDRRRRRAEILVAQLIEQGVGTDRLVARPHQLEHATAQRREAQALVGAQLLGGNDPVLHAVIVVVTFAGRLVVRGGLGGFFHHCRIAKRVWHDYRPPSPSRPTMPKTYPQAAIDKMLAAIQFDAQGLVPAIAQQHDTGEVLMMAYMD